MALVQNLISVRTSYSGSHNRGRRSRLNTIFSSGVGLIERDKCAIFRKNCAIVTHARVCCEDSAQRKTNKMASEITFVGDEEIQFLYMSSVSLRNLRQALEENFLDSDSECDTDSDDGSERIGWRRCIGHVKRGFPR